MPTSGVTAWSLTARDIIVAALSENMILPLGEQPEASELDACLLRLNALLKSLPAGMHHETTGDVVVPADTASVMLDADVDDLLTVNVIQTTGTERLLHRWGRDQYLSLPNKAQGGTPSMYHVTRQLGGVVLYLWPVPTAETTLKISYARVPETVTNASETVDFPSRWNEAMFANLAVRCAGIFGQQAPPELIARAQRLEREMFDADRPDAYYLEGSGYCA